MENLKTIKVYATAKEAYEELYDNVTAMLLVQGMKPSINKEEMYITFENKKNKDVNNFVQQEVEAVFGKCDKSIRFRIKQGKLKSTINFIVSGRWE